MIRLAAVACDFCGTEEEPNEALPFSALEVTSFVDGAWCVRMVHVCHGEPCRALPLATLLAVARGPR